MRTRRLLTPLLALVIGSALLAGCGSSSSTTKPAYCSALSSLQASIKNLPDTVKQGTSALQTTFVTAQQQVTTLVNSGKSELSSETAAVKSSFDTLAGTVKQVQSSSSVGAIAQLPGEVSAFETAIKNFASAAKSKCG